MLPTAMPISERAKQIEIKLDQDGVLLAPQALIRI
jgi:hypothetical protein